MARRVPKQREMEAASDESLLGGPEEYAGGELDELVLAELDPIAGLDATAGLDTVELSSLATEPVSLAGIGTKSGSNDGLNYEREQLLMDNLPTVRFIARRIHERLPQHVELEELISAGMLGLLDACQKFDTKKNVQFKSYAQFRIRGAILDSLRTLDWSPRELRRKGRMVEEAIRSVTARRGRAAQEPEIAEELNMSLVEYQQLLGELKGLEIGSLNAERSEDTGEEEMAFIPNSPEEDPLFRCLKGEMRQYLIDAIESLPEKERLVVTLYYYEELTMKEIGLTLGVVESRISQIHSSAVLHLRASLQALGSKAAAATAQKNMAMKPMRGGMTEKIRQQAMAR